jgi:ABC-type glycerol-3-phosphate transport system substrate-binding protein
MHDMTARYVNETPLVKIEDIQGVPDFIQKFIASSVAGSPPDVVWIRKCSPRMSTRRAPCSYTSC